MKSFSATTPAPCWCPALVGLNEENRDEYNPEWTMDGWIVPYTINNVSINQADSCYKSTVHCPNDLYLFYGGPQPAPFPGNQEVTLDCKKNNGVPQWNWGGNWMTNAAFGCVKPEPSEACYCAPLQAMSDTTRATYDPNNEMKGEINPVAADLAAFAGNTLCYKASITCDTDLYIYATGNSHYVQKLTGKVLLKCMKQPGGSYEWWYGTQMITKPAYACIV